MKPALVNGRWARRTPGEKLAKPPKYDVYSLERDKAAGDKALPPLVSLDRLLKYGDKLVRMEELKDMETPLDWLLAKEALLRRIMREETGSP